MARATTPKQQSAVLVARATTPKQNRRLLVARATTPKQNRRLLVARATTPKHQSAAPGGSSPHPQAESTAPGGSRHHPQSRIGGSWWLAPPPQRRWALLQRGAVVPLMRRISNQPGADAAVDVRPRLGERDPRSLTPRETARDQPLHLFAAPFDRLVELETRRLEVNS